ncbi:hypothetical protein [Tardiphaga sp. 709]|uniref:hypothetical protein n=1 Tax=Tardiphaga sp. 709 TaxID=3076039 RepID=UPI0028EF6B89|nr:hypothetical protein [Tardiphaga sp. 709]WNV10276.1 hypothetical protein RSO67_03515 [Tardiphaga sp. 709]
MEGAGQSLAVNEGRATPGKAKTRIKKLLLEIFSGLTWAYVLTTLFLFNIDALIAAQLGDHAWLVSYKSIIFLGVLALISWITSPTGTIKTLLFVLFWPLLKVIWTLPKALVWIGSWSLALGILSAAASFFYKFRQNVTLAFCFILCQTAPFVIQDKYVLATLAITNLLVLFWLYVRATLSIFQPNILFSAYRTAVTKSTVFVVKHTRLDDDIKATPVSKLETTQISKRSESLAQALIFGRACTFAARKLPALHSKGYATVAGAISILSLIFFATIIFTTVNFSIHKTYPNAFETIGTPSYFKFWYYSFFSFLNRDIKDIVAVSDLAQASAILEATFSLFTVLVFAATLISYRTEKYSTQLAETASTIETQSREIEAHVMNEWSLSPEDAFKELERARSGALALIIWLTNNTK